MYLLMLNSCDYVHSIIMESETKRFLLIHLHHPIQFCTVQLYSIWIPTSVIVLSSAALELEYGAPVQSYSCWIFYLLNKERCILFSNPLVISGWFGFLNWFCRAAHEAGAATAIVNVGMTRADDFVPLKITARLGEVWLLELLYTCITWYMKAFLIVGFCGFIGSDTAKIAQCGFPQHPCSLGMVTRKQAMRLNLKGSVR